MGNTYLIGHIIVVLGVCLSAWVTTSREGCLRNIYNDSINVIRIMHLNKVNCSGSLEPRLGKSHHRRKITSNETFGDQHRCIFKLSWCPKDHRNNNEMSAINDIRCDLQKSINSSKECKWKNQTRKTLSKLQFLNCWCGFLGANPNA